MPLSGEPCYHPGRIVLGKYELSQPLAEGGMGVVWVARHRALEVDVAVKLTLGDASEESRARQQRALSEARLAAQLEHPAVCRVLDFGLTAEGDPCVVTELLRGETLDRVLLVEGRLAPAAAVQIILPVLDALAVAHEHGIVHQDVKPSNIFLARDAQQRLQPKLLDFGIARAQREPASWEQAGTVSGTPCYMSPEQASGSADIDHRSDLWSACATLYELLSGVPPFDGQTCASLLTRVIQAEPRPLDPAVEDAELSVILRRGLEKRRERRWSSASELALALARWLLARGVEVDASGRALRGRLPASELSPSAVASSGTLVSQPAPQSRASHANREATSSKRVRASRGATLALGALLALTTSVSLLKARSGPASATPAEPPPLVAARVLPSEPGPSTGAAPSRDAKVRDENVRDESVTSVPDVPDVPASATATSGVGTAIKELPSVLPSPESPLAPAAPRIAELPAQSPAGAAAKVEIVKPIMAPARTPRPTDNELGYDFGF